MESKQRQKVIHRGADVKCLEKQEAHTQVILQTVSGLYFGGVHDLETQRAKSLH